MAEKKQPAKIKRKKHGTEDTAVNAAKRKQHAKLRVTLAKSIINTSESHRATVRGLGLRRRHDTVEIEDTPAVRGMINKVGYLVKCEE